MIRSTAALCAVLVVLLLSTSCIRSRVVITSDPPGADVTFNKMPRGRTPVTIPIIWYWYYDIKLEKPGYEPLATTERFHAPIWFYIPLDLVMEAIPIPIYDTKKRHYALAPSEEL
jgi:hypothetical protein